ncbi:putative mitochondrial protein, partial [Tanacetum coccineum]
MSKLVSQTENVQASSLCCIKQTTTLKIMHCMDDQNSQMNEKLNQLLEDYVDVFTIPKELPPYRSFDHKIPLKTDNVSINIRPYRYPPTQKDTIEAMIKELHDSGVVRPSNSPFSSPIVMELTDELHGAEVFSKLDLKLTNAPSTFQALMNYVFKPFLRKFTLVFLDDILVNSPSRNDHIRHLRMVLQTMRDNTLFVKKFKFMFGTTQVEFLGYVISAQGVSTDPSKITAMKYWLVPTTLKRLR